MANRALKTKPDKQVLTFPAHRSGGGVHASSPHEVWQIDTADMRTFLQPGSKNPATHLLVAVDVFTRKTFAKPMHGATAEQAAIALKEFIFKGMMRIAKIRYRCHLQD